MPDAPPPPGRRTVPVDAATADALAEIGREIGARDLDDVVDALIAAHRDGTPPARAVTGAPRRRDSSV